MQYDLEDRTLRFSEEVIYFCKSIRLDTISRPLVSQLVRSATSVGANYREANGACSKKDFKNKMHLCKKEIQETKYWLNLIKNTDIDYSEKMINIEKEAHELTLIFNKIVFTLVNSKN